MTLSRCLLLGVMLLLTVPATSCRSTGGECDSCSSDSDCSSGLVCSTFSDGSKRCGSGLGATNCRVRSAGTAPVRR